MDFMKQKMMLVAVLLVAAFIVKAQNTGVKNLGTYKTSKINKIEIDGRLSILLVSEDMQQNISAEGDAELLNDVAATFDGNKLVIASKSDADYRGKVIIKVPVKNLASLEINGASEVVSTQALQS